MNRIKHRDNKGPLAGIQSMRALAAMMVVWAHAREQFEWLRVQFPSDMGAHGVDLFFVISGLIMVVSTQNRRTLLSRFVLRRIVRIVPLYWLATFTLLAAALSVPSLLKTTVVSWPHVLQSLFFIPAESPSLKGLFMPFVIPGWTLNYEMFFYFLFGISRSRFPTNGKACLVGFLAILSLLGLAYKPAGVAGFYCDPIIFTFGLGMIIGELFCRGHMPSSKILSIGAASVGISLFLILQAADSDHRLISAGIPAAIVVIAVLSSPQNTIWPTPLTRIGDASYSIYLAHIFVLGALRFLHKQLLGSESDAWMGWSFMIAALVCSAGIGYLVYRYIENPLTQMLQKAVDTHAR